MSSMPFQVPDAICGRRLMHVWPRSTGRRDVARRFGGVSARERPWRFIVLARRGFPDPPSTPSLPYQKDTIPLERSLNRTHKN